MKLALSNFAWDSNENETIFKSLQSMGITHIEGVLTKISEWDNLTDKRLKEFKDLMDSYGIKMESIQSIFYGVKCSDLTDKKTVTKHFIKLIKCCRVLGVKTMVLGSPSLRKSNDGWDEKLSSILSDVDKLLTGTGIELSIEPNMRGYGGDYFFTIDEIVDFIVSNDFKNIKTMVDTHNVKLEDLDPLNEFKKYFDYINHIHVSEPSLKPLSDFDFHKSFSNVLKSNNYKGIVTYEVMKCDNIIDSVNDFVEIYK